MMNYKSQFIGQLILFSVVQQKQYIFRPNTEIDFTTFYGKPTYLQFQFENLIKLYLFVIICIYVTKFIQFHTIAVKSKNVFNVNLKLTLQFFCDWIKFYFFVTQCMLYSCILDKAIDNSLLAIYKATSTYNTTLLNFIHIF